MMEKNTLTHSNLRFCQVACKFLLASLCFGHLSVSFFARLLRLRQRKKSNRERGDTKKDVCIFEQKPLSCGFAFEGFRLCTLEETGNRVRRKKMIASNILRFCLQLGQILQGEFCLCCNPRFGPFLRLDLHRVNNRISVNCRAQKK